MTRFTITVKSDLSNRVDHIYFDIDENELHRVSEKHWKKHYIFQCNRRLGFQLLRYFLLFFKLTTVAELNETDEKVRRLNCQSQQSTQSPSPKK